MKVEININKDNKDKVLRLLDELVEAESGTSEGIKQVETKKYAGRPFDYTRYIKYIDRPSNYIHDLLVPAKIEPSEFGFGTNFLFNSFFASKAMLRVIANLTNEKRNPIEQQQALEIFNKAAIARDLQKYNGFPKERAEKHEGSKLNRPLYSILIPLSQIGMLRIDGTKLLLTKQGLEFAMLPNPKLDENKEELLSNEEINYLVNYLKEIDKQGYKEYTFLNQLLNFIKEKSKYEKIPEFQDLVDFLKKNEKFVDYIYENSKFGKKGLPKNDYSFSNKVKRTTQAVIASRIALLRELRVIEDKRNSYRIINDILR